MRDTKPSTPAAPGRAYFDLPFRPLTAVPEPLRLAGQMLVRDLLNLLGMGVMAVAVAGLLLMSAAIASHSLPAAIGMVLVGCFGASFSGYVLSKARSFGGGA